MVLKFSDSLEVYFRLFDAERKDKEDFLKNLGLSKIFHSLGKNKKEVT